MKPEVKVIANMEIYYLDVFEDLNMVKFNALIYTYKISNKDYGGIMAAEYYCILRVNTLQNLFVKSFFEALE